MLNCNSAVLKTLDFIYNKPDGRLKKTYKWMEEHGVIYSLMFLGDVCKLHSKQNCFQTQQILNSYFYFPNQIYVN